MGTSSARAAAPVRWPVTLFLALLALPAVSLSGQEQHDGAVTFSRDVAPIVQENCQICHRPGSVGPFSLLSYETARPFAPLIKQKVSARQMPPYHLDMGVGIQDIKDDWRLSEEEIATIVAWVDQGALEGDPVDLPPAIEWPDRQLWQLEDILGPPDHVMKS